MTGSDDGKGPKSNALGEIAGALFGAVGSSAIAAFQKPESDTPPVNPSGLGAAPETSRGLVVQSQGISDDWLMADGNYRQQTRGLFGADLVLSAMSQLARLGTPDEKNACPPSLLIQSPSGPLAFIGQGDSIFRPETNQELDSKQATRLALEGIARANVSAPPSSHSSTGGKGNGTLYEEKPVQRKLGWRGITVLVIACVFFITSAVMVAGAFSMRARGVAGSDVLLAWTIAGATGFIGVVLVILAFRNRS